MVSDPANSTPQPLWLKVVSFIIALGTLVYTAQDLGRSMEPVAALRSAGGAAYEEGGGELAERERERHPLYFAVFNGVMGLGAMYAAMLFNNWSYTSALQQFALDKGVASMWVKLACEWAAAVLYLWMLLAPVLGRRLCPSREFV